MSHAHAHPCHVMPIQTPKPNINALEKTAGYKLAKQAYHQNGISVFFRGLGICSARAFIVNAVQWAVYEWMMHFLAIPKHEKHVS